MKAFKLSMRDEDQGYEGVEFEADSFAGACEQAERCAVNWGRQGDWGNRGYSFDVRWELFDADDGEPLEESYTRVNIAPNINEAIIEELGVSRDHVHDWIFVGRQCDGYESIKSEQCDTCGTRVEIKRDHFGGEELVAIDRVECRYALRMHGDELRVQGDAVDVAIITGCDFDDAMRSVDVEIEEFVDREYGWDEADAGESEKISWEVFSLVGEMDQNTFCADPIATGVADVTVGEDGAIDVEV